MRKNKILIICDASGGGIYEYAKPLFIKIKDKVNAKFLARNNENFFHRLNYYKSIISEILFGNYTVIDIQQLIWPLHVLIILLREIKGFKLVFDAHEEPWTIHTKLRPMLIRSLIFNTSDKLVTHSQNNERILKSLRYKNVIYAPIATNLEQLHFFNIDKARKKLDWKDKYYVLSFGWITYNKGIDILLKAVPLVTKEVSGVKFVISGKVFDDWKPYQKIIDSLKLKNFIIRNEEFMPWEKVSQFFSASDIVVMPYREANNSSVPSVAYFFKKPIVATDDGAFREMIHNNKNGILVKRENIEELADAIVKLLKNKKLRLEYGRRGYKLLNTQFSWKLITDVYLNKVFK